MGRSASLRLLSTFAVALALAGCGGDRGGPRGTPQAVVDAAPDRTLAAGRAHYEAAAPGAQQKGEVAFGTVPEVGAEEGPAHPELANPSSVVDLVRGAVDAVSYGGSAVRGASTFRYETVINVERAVRETPAPRRAAIEAMARQLGSPAFYADVWIDGDGRLRRVQVPVEKTTERPATRSKERPALVTVDFFDFAGS